VIAQPVAEAALRSQDGDRFEEALQNLLRGRSASLQCARILAYHFDMSRILRALRLASHPARGVLQRFLECAGYAAYAGASQALPMLMQAE
jgi:hypothetical protein